MARRSSHRSRQRWRVRWPVYRRRSAAQPRAKPAASEREGSALYGALAFLEKRRADDSECPPSGRETTPTPCASPLQYDNMSVARKLTNRDYLLERSWSETESQRGVFSVKGGAGLARPPPRIRLSPLSDTFALTYVHFYAAIGGPKRRMAPPACSASPSTSSAPADKPSPASSTSFSAPRQPRAAASASRRSSARCGLSIVAVALLWLTSLSSTLAILEAGGFVATPRFALVTREVEVRCFAQCLLPLLPSHSGTLN